jgi:hypothetical protein
MDTLSAILYRATSAVDHLANLSAPVRHSKKPSAPRVMAMLIARIPCCSQSPLLKFYALCAVTVREVHIGISEITCIFHHEYHLPTFLRGAVAFQGSSLGIFFDKDSELLWICD